MTVKDLYSAMSGIEDRYLAMADAPNKEDISMKKHSGKLRFFLIAAALVSLLGVTAYAVTAKIQAVYARDRRKRRCKCLCTL